MKVTLEEMAAKVEGLKKKLDSPGPLLKSIGVLLVSSTRRRFREGKAPSGRKWKPLSKVTLAARRGGTHPLLDKGMLRDSVNFQVSSDAVTIGTVLKQARVHQLGATIRPKRAKMLAIPLKKEARARSPRDFPDLFVWRRFGKVFLARASTRGNLSLMYLLKRSVKIPARAFIGISREDERDMTDIVHEFIARSI